MSIICSLIYIHLSPYYHSSLDNDVRNIEMSDNNIIILVFFFNLKVILQFEKK